MPGENRSEDQCACQTIPTSGIALASCRLVRLRYNRSRVPELFTQELVMSRLQFLVAVTAALVSSVPASAHFGLLFRPRTTTAYYYAVPVVEVCIPPVVWVPVDAPPRLFAQPLAAPATSGKEPPLA